MCEVSRVACSLFDNLLGADEDISENVLVGQPATDSRGKVFALPEVELAVHDGIEIPVAVRVSVAPRPAAEEDEADEAAAFLEEAVEEAKLGVEEKVEALKRLRRFIWKNTS